MAVYILHFKEPYHHARHYIGYTSNFERRLQEHLSGQGSPLVKAVVQAGIEVQTALVIDGDRALERTMKNRKKASVFCPICKEMHRCVQGEKS